MKHLFSSFLTLLAVAGLATAQTTKTIHDFDVLATPTAADEMLVWQTSTNKTLKLTIGGLLGSPGPIGSTTPSTGKFTTLNITDTTTSTNRTTGAVTIAGGLGVSGSVNSLSPLTTYVGGAVQARLSHSAGTGGGYLAFANGAGGGLDAFLVRDTVDVLAMRNGTAPQTFRIYNTYTDSANNEYGLISWGSNRLSINTASSGTGTFRGVTIGGFDITLRANAADRWTINSGGHFIAATDNSYDIGSSGSANRPRNIYAAGHIQVGGLSQLQFGISRCSISSLVDGNLLLMNNVGNNFDRLQFGGTTSTFPALKKNGATLETRLADDSGLAATQSLYQRFGAGTPEGTVSAPIGATYSRTDGGAGTSFYVKESGTGNTGWVAK